MRVALSIAMVAMACLSAADARASADPEIPDAIGDAMVWAFPAPPTVAPGPFADLVDIRAAWIDEVTSDELVLKMSTVDFAAFTYNTVDPLADLMMVIVFEVDGVVWDVRADMLAVNGFVVLAEWTYVLRPDRSWEDNVDLEGNVDEETATVTFHVPRDAIAAHPGSVLNMTGATVQLATTSGVDWVDFATGNGNLYTFPTGSASGPGPEAPVLSESDGQDPQQANTTALDAGQELEGKESSAPAVAILAAAVLIMARRRRA